MPNTSTQKIVAIMLVAATAFLFLWGLGILIMPAMMSGMMPAMMGGAMMGSMAGRAMCAAGPVLLGAVLLVLGLVLLRIKP